MFKRLSLQIGRQAVMAAMVGSACGTAAALWSVRPHSGRVPAGQASPTAVITKSPVLTRETPAPRSSIQPDAPASATAVSAPMPAEVDGQDVRLRARALAARPDVKALVALRETVARHAENEGETEASKQLLDDLDRYLEGARALRLKLDAEEFRNAKAVASQPR